MGIDFKVLIRLGKQLTKKILSGAMLDACSNKHMSLSANTKCG